MAPRTDLRWWWIGLDCGCRRPVVADDNPPPVAWCVWHRSDRQVKHIAPGTAWAPRSVPGADPLAQV